MVNAFDVFGGCVSLVWIGKLFGALNVNDIGVVFFVRQKYFAWYW